MPAALRGAIAATVLGLTLSLGACGAADAPGASPEPATATTAPPVSPGSAPPDALVSPSALPQGLVTSSTFEVGDRIHGVVTRVSPLLVLITGNGRAGVIRGSAYEKVQVGDHVIVQITKPDGRFEATLVHVSTKH